MICPVGCNYYHENSWSKNIIQCSNKDYQNLPTNIPMDATEIYLDGNNLGVSRVTVWAAEILRVLYLINSNIERIENKTFNGLKRVRALHLENNNMRSLRIWVQLLLLLVTREMAVVTMTRDCRPVQEVRVWGSSSLLLILMHFPMLHFELMTFKHVLKHFRTQTICPAVMPATETNWCCLMAKQAYALPQCEQCKVNVIQCSEGKLIIQIELDQESKSGMQQMDMGGYFMPTMPSPRGSSLPPKSATSQDGQLSPAW